MSYLLARCVQGMLQLMEDKVVVRCREVDAQLVEV